MTEPEDLYGLPLDRFVPERGALAKALRAQGRRDDAASVAGLRKPSVAAWTVNQLLRTQSRAVAGLFEAGDELQHAQANVLAGKEQADALRAAAARERAAVAKLAETARGLLSSDGREPSPTTLERVSETLHAIALDPGARAHVKDGCLDRELVWAGFGESGVAGPGALGPGAKEERAERARAEELKAARKAEADARRLAERADRDRSSAEERRDHAAEQLREAEDALAAATERAEQAAREHRQAQQALGRV